MEDVLFRLFLELVGTKDTNTVDGLGLGETSFVTLEESEDILHDNVLDIDLVLIVQVGGSELDLDMSQGTVQIVCLLTVFMSTLACRFCSFSPCSMSLYSRFFRTSGSAADVSWGQETLVEGLTSRGIAGNLFGHGDRGLPGDVSS